jgi:hypothetical protein
MRRTSGSKASGSICIAVDSARPTLDFLAKLATNYWDIRLDYDTDT